MPRGAASGPSGCQAHEDAADKSYGQAQDGIIAKNLFKERQDHRNLEAAR